MLTTTNGVLIGLVCATTLAVMTVWHVRGRGAWRRWPAGRSVMGLLAIITAITALATVSTFVGPFSARPVIYTGMYSLLELAIVLIGVTIIGAQRERRAATTSPKETTLTTPAHRAATQTEYPWRATIRTTLWAIVAFAAMAPAIYSAATQQEPGQAVGWVAIALAILGAIQRVMTLPVVDAWLRRWLPWLAASPRDDDA